MDQRSCTVQGFSNIKGQGVTNKKRCKGILGVSCLINGQPACQLPVAGDNKFVYLQLVTLKWVVVRVDPALPAAVEIRASIYALETVPKSRPESATKYMPHTRTAASL